jgi:hypothetical protein
MKVISYPAIAEQDEVWAGRSLLRRKGVALFPELKPLDFLLERLAWQQTSAKLCQTRG